MRMRTSEREMTADQLKALRLALKLTQAQLAEKLDVHRSAVARWESGYVQISHLVELALKTLKDESPCSS